MVLLLLDIFKIVSLIGTLSSKFLYHSKLPSVILFQIMVHCSLLTLFHHLLLSLTRTLMIMDIVESLMGFLRILDTVYGDSALEFVL